MSEITPFTIALPILVACLLLAVGKVLPRVVVDGIAIAACSSVLVLDVLLLAATSSTRVVTWAGGWRPTDGITFGIVLVADQIGVGMALIAAVLVLAALVFSIRYYDTQQAHFHALLLLFLTGMTGFSLTGDLFEMLVFFELMGAAAYALTAFVIEDRTAVHGALNFGIVNSLGAYVTLFGIAMLYSRTGQLGLAQLAVALAGKSADVLLIAAFVLICTGWLVKAAVVPFHFWTADAEAVAPSPVCAVLSGAMVVLGLYGTARLYWTVFAATIGPDGVRSALLILGALTCLVGSVMCLLQRNLKRLLAYSTIAHVGLLLILVGVLRADALTGAVVYSLAQAGAKGALFLLTGVLLKRFGSVDERALHGRGRRTDPVGWAMIAGALALAAMPPFGTALGKTIADDAVPLAGAGWAPLVFLAVSAATGGAVLRATGRIFFGLGPPPSGDEPHAAPASMGTGEGTASRITHVPATMLVPVVLLLGGSLAVGLAPGVAQAAADAAARFTDMGGYVTQALALQVRHRAASPGPVVHGWSLPGILLGSLSAAAAAGVAAAGLYATPTAPSHLLSPGRRVLNGLRAMHSGHVGDYVAWLLVGLAALLAMMELPLLL